MTETFKQHLGNLLKKDTRLLDEQGELMGNKIKDLADKLDETFIGNLLEDEQSRKHFFLKIKEVYVFKVKEFKFFLEQNKLDNSFTNYANQIGLSFGGKYLKDNTDVVLNFPFKDCILEGGQSTEEGLDTYFEYDESVTKTDEKKGLVAEQYNEKQSKRKEIFFNEVIARDEIDRLLEPKAFTNITKFDSKGESTPTQFNRDAKLNKERGLPLDTITDNLILKGNNLLALHSLNEEFKGKVKLIYIDPPYNTGSDSFSYNDNFNHSTWLTFMNNRFNTAKNLLKDDGFIVVQCDDNEQAYLKVLMDISLEMHYVTSICVQMSYVSGEKMAHIDKKPPKIKEFLHIYSVKKGTKIKPQYTTKGVDFEYNKFIVKNDSKDFNDWEVINLNDVFKKHKLKDNEEKEEFMLNNAENIFNRVRNKAKSFKETIGNKSLQKITTATGLNKWAWNGREVVLLSDRVITDYDGNLTYSQALGDIWDDIPIVNLYLEGGVSLPKGKKPEFLIERIANMLSNEGEIILDYHIGSGTTGAVAHKINRQYIGCEQIDSQVSLIKERLKNVISGEKSGISDKLNWQGGGSFIYLELAKNNQTAKEQIQVCNSYKELLVFFEEIYTKYFLHYNVRIKEFKEVVSKEENFKKLPLEKQKEFFCKMLDNNQLYVNASEMEDSRYKIDKENIALTKDFYQIK